MLSLTYSLSLSLYRPIALQSLHAQLIILHGKTNEKRAGEGRKGSNMSPIRTVITRTHVMTERDREREREGTARELPASADIKAIASDESTPR